MSPPRKARREKCLHHIVSWGRGELRITGGWSCGDATYVLSIWVVNINLTWEFILETPLGNRHRELYTILCNDLYGKRI